jgi:hypothetical protein
VTAAQGLQGGGLVLAVGLLLATAVARALPEGWPRRFSEETGIILACAGPAIAVLAPYVRHRVWPIAVIIAIAYGGFFLLRSWQLRRANRDGVRRLLGLHRDASYGEVLQQVERLEPRPVTFANQVILAVSAAAVLVVADLLGLLVPAFTALCLGVGEATARAAYYRQLGKKVRQIGH